MSKYAFWPGCVAQGAAPELYTSTLAVAEQLGMDLVELEAAAFRHCARRHYANRYRVRAVHLERHVNIGRRRLRPGQQHHTFKPVGGVAECAPVLAPGLGRERVRRLAP